MGHFSKNDESDTDNTDKYANKHTKIAYVYDI